MEYIIFFIILVLLIWHFTSKHELKTQVAKEGGMNHKYRELINNLQIINPQFILTDLGHDSLTLGYSSGGGKEQFFLKQQIRQINIIWEVNTYVFGLHRLDWNFHEYEDTETILERIVDDISKYQNNILTNNNNQVIVEKAFQKTTEIIAMPLKNPLNLAKENTIGPKKNEIDDSKKRANIGINESKRPILKKIDKSSDRY
jgi:hypothetical protein